MRILEDREICSSCHLKKDCSVNCPAIETLYDIYETEDKRIKNDRIRRLRNILGIVDAEVSKELEKLGCKIINRFPQFGFIKEFNISIGYVKSWEKKQGQKIVYADCRKVNEIYKAYLPYDFIITFYERNTGMLSDNQKKILMLHELSHIMIGEKGLTIRPHDIEDFKYILESYGINWDGYNSKVPDILAGDNE